MDFLITQENYALISKDTPLISNLNMYENIALIKEVHEHLNTKDAQLLADQYLQKINLQHIGTKRLNQCNEIEKFYVMIIRALMTKQDNVIISSPFSITKTLMEMEDILNNIQILNSNTKNITILDIKSNKSHYKDNLCNIIK